VCNANVRPVWLNRFVVAAVIDVCFHGAKVR
jgi:hypothetical protein